MFKFLELQTTKNDIRFTACLTIHIYFSIELFHEQDSDILHFIPFPFLLILESLHRSHPWLMGWSPHLSFHAHCSLQVFPLIKYCFWPWRNKQNRQWKGKSHWSLWKVSVLEKRGSYLCALTVSYQKRLCPLNIWSHLHPAMGLTMKLSETHSFLKS